MITSGLDLSTDARGTELEYSVPVRTELEYSVPLASGVKHIYKFEFNQLIKYNS